MRERGREVLFLNFSKTNRFIYFLQGYLSFWSTHSFDIKSEGRYDDWAPFNVSNFFIRLQFLTMLLYHR